MKIPQSLLRFIAKAALNQGLFGVGGDLIVEVIPEVARNIWQEWHKHRTLDEKQADLESLAQTEPLEMHRFGIECVRELAFDQPQAIQQSLELYLNQLPGSIRRSLARPDDPLGTTVPLELIPNKAEDWIRFLPHKLPRFKVGDRPLGVGGSWQLKQLLGISGFGEVWQACNSACPNLTAALKFCNDPTVIKILKNAADLLDQLIEQGKHPGIVELRQIHLEAETPCLEYEYVPGGELTGLILNWHRQGQPSPIQAARVIQRLTEIVGFAHSLNPSMVHRDLKPANILVYQDQNETQFKITDFGIGGLSAQQLIRETQRGIPLGTLQTNCLRGAYTPLYASPQQQRGEPADPRDDVYALGVIWYQLLTGDLTQSAPSGTQWMERLRALGMSDELIVLLAGCFEPEVNDRPVNAQVLLEHLTSALKAVPQEAVGNRIATRNIIIEDLGNGVTLEMVAIPGGRFLMGSPEGETGRYDDESPQYEVTVEPFYMGKYPITQAQYESIMGNNPSYFQGADHPVEQVSWQDAQSFCEKLSTKLGQLYRLPSESEWEYACRAGTTTVYYFGDDKAELGDYAWFANNSGNQVIDSDQIWDADQANYFDRVVNQNQCRTHPVGQKQSNNWGLYDMHGNVWEWCLDHWHENYKGAPTNGSAWIERDNRSRRLLRGGSWYFQPRYCRSAHRLGDYANDGDFSDGFRVACSAAGN